MFADAFAGRRVLVTGHTGFKGSWLSIWLQRLGAQVSGLALAPETQPSNFEVSRVHQLLGQDVRADIRDRTAVAALVERTNPEVIFHLAAQPLVRRGLLEPLETFDVNVRGTATVLDVVRTWGQPCVVVVVTSDKCYRPARHSHAEGDHLGGSEPYGASKAAAEMVAEAYRCSYFRPSEVGAHGVKVATVRAGNVIGGGDWSADRIVPDLVSALAAGRPVTVRAPGAVRPWQHVLVPLSGYLELAGQLLTTPSPAPLCRGWNFGPTGAPDISVQELVETSIGLWGEGSWSPAHDTLTAHEAPYLGLDSTLAADVLGWSPSWAFGQSVAATIGWYRRYYLQGYNDMRDACSEDIDKYMEASRLGPGAKAEAGAAQPADEAWPVGALSAGGRRA